MGGEVKIANTGQYDFFIWITGSPFYLASDHTEWFQTQQSSVI